jgi:hypothetical protein
VNDASDGVDERAAQAFARLRAISQAEHTKLAVVPTHRR